MALRFRSIAAGAAAALFTLAPLCHEAHACGGGAFYPPDAQTATVSGHRVVISLSTTQTVLWDQIAYQGDAADFAWVMPVPDGARVEEASDAWVEVLDAATVTRIAPPQLSCSSPSSSAMSCGGCGPGSDRGISDVPVSGGGNQPDGPEVTITHEGSVGPYETVTIKSDTPDAIGKWLTDNGYAIPADVQPILTDYAAKGMSFIALRLKPGNGVEQMKPVRVIMPGALTTFPMRMLSAGAEQKVGIKLFVLSEGRVQVSGFPNAEIDRSKVSWDFASELSSYDDLRQEALSAEGGKTWLTTYARTQAPLKTALQLRPESGNIAAIANAYFEQGSSNGEIPSPPGCGVDIKLADSDLKVVNPCPPDGGACATVGEGELDARKLECSVLKDVSAALLGMHLKDVWVSRFEAELPREALTQDLTLSPSSSTTELESLVTATKATNEPEDCDPITALPPGNSPSSPLRPPSRRDLSTITISLAALLVALGRRARRQRPALVPLRVG